MRLGAAVSLCLLLSCGAAGNEAPAKSPAAEALRRAALDTADLTAREQHELERYLTALPAPCAEVAVPVATCLAEDRACPRCKPAAAFLLKGVRDGLSSEQIERGYRTRFAANPATSIAIDGSPSRGPETAKVTVVEFADFECPYCGTVAPELDAAWEKRKDRVRFVYKFFPLDQIHPHAEGAARAAIAAAAQGKFWEMHHELFSHQRTLEASDLEKFATAIGLDLAKFRSDLDSKETTERIARDRALADTLHVTSTPSIFINGQPVELGGSLADRLDAELNGAGAP